MGPDVQPLPLEAFLRTFDLVPRAAVCLLVRDATRGVLLAKRAEGMAMAGAWHLPGAFLLRNEPIADCVARIARKELGVGVAAWRPFGFFEDLDGDPRGHVIDLVVEVETGSEPAPPEETGAVRYFDTVPDGLGFHHDRIVRSAGLP